MPNSTFNVAVLLVASAVLIPAQASTCPFHYNQKVIDLLVIPELRTKYGDNYTWYDTKNPGVLRKKNIVELIFSQSRTDVLDTPNFVIAIDACRLKIMKAYETSPFPER